MCLVNKLFEQTGIEEAIQQIQSVSGGSINDSYWIQTASQQYFMKVHTDSPQDFFHIEKTGLDQIRSTKTIHVPEVINYSDEQGEAYLLMEWVEGKQTSKTDVMLWKKPCIDASTNEFKTWILFLIHILVHFLKQMQCVLPGLIIIEISG